MANNSVRKNVGESSKNKISANSFFKTPIDKPDSVLKGNSRAWGDASKETKKESIKALLNESMKRGLSKSQASFVLATSYVESGFNPDAAATSTSAGGLGQFVNKTGEACGVGGLKKFDVKEASGATVRYLKSIYDGVVRRGPDLSEEERFVETYARFHDGGIVSEVTREELSRERVLPLVNVFEGHIGEMERAGEIEYEPQVSEEVLGEDREYRALGCVL